MVACLLLLLQALPGTEPLELEGDPAARMVDGMHRFLDRKTAASVADRARHWRRDPSSPEAYEKSVTPNRARLARMLGVVDKRVAPKIEYVATTKRPSLVGGGPGFEIHAVRWPVFRDVHGEGLLLWPLDRKPVFDVIVLPDADTLPEQLAGLRPGVPPARQLARRLAEAGCRVVVPMLIDRSDEFSVSHVGIGTNQPHREFVYRPAFELGRHIIGYEVQKVLALVDSLAPGVAVVGHGEGGLVALYAAALDTRIDAAVISGYFGPREELWKEPIYRNVFGLLDEFGDAEIASLVAPRAFITTPHPAPAVDGPPKPRKGRRGGAAPGAWTSPDAATANRELTRAAKLVGRIEGAAPDMPDEIVRVVTVDGEPKGDVTTHLKDFDPKPRLKRQFDELVEDTQGLLRRSEKTRTAFWKGADVEKMREVFATRVIGRFDDTPVAPRPRSRKFVDTPAFKGYEVALDVFPDVFAYGILLVPGDMKRGERRPAVVCQHGLEGNPRNLADPSVDHKAYKKFGCRLAEEGFVVFAPQNPYVGRDRFRSLQRKLNPLGKTLFSLIVPQHRAITGWLASLPFVDPDRVGFYGLSYGGKTAMRVPPLVPRYALSICSGDFNEWIWKNASTRSRYSYVTTGEYEIFEWDLGNTFNYAEMARLIAPRPFMVERGHRDGVAPDERVAYEYAKVRRHYADLGIPDRTEIEFFDGPHAIHGVGTFAFLRKHLRMPR